ncbi:MAG: hypothetical protein ACO20H_12880 [Bacteriovoracaceae bacterium]
MRNIIIVFTLFICFNSYAQSRAPAVEPILTIVNEQETAVAPSQAKGFDFKKEENEFINLEVLLKNLSQKSGRVPLAITILFLMIAPAAISFSILSSVKNLEKENEMEILFEEKAPLEAPISLDDYRNSKQSEEDFKKAG